MLNGNLSEIIAGSRTQRDYDAIKSMIPAHLLKEASEAEQHMLSTISILEQRAEFLRAEVAGLEAQLAGLGVEIENTRQNFSKEISNGTSILDKTQARIQELEAFHAKAKSFWALLFIIGSIVMGLLEAVKLVTGFFHK